MCAGIIDDRPETYFLFSLLLTAIINLTCHAWILQATAWGRQYYCHLCHCVAHKCGTFMCKMGPLWHHEALHFYRGKACLILKIIKYFDQLRGDRLCSLINVEIVHLPAQAHKSRELFLLQNENTTQIPKS